MRKAKGRHHPNKRQNNYGSRCSYYEDGSGRPEPGCELLLDARFCGGNRHNCIKGKYVLEASRVRIRRRAPNQRRRL